MSSHPVKSISFENYKAFKVKQKMNLKPMTLLFGYNNTGKSAAIRLLPLIANSFKPNKPRAYVKSFLDYTANCVRGATFRDLAHANQNKMSFGMEWEGDYSIDFDLKQDGADPEVMTSFSVGIGQLNGLKQTFKFVQHIGEGDQFDEQYEDTENSAFLVKMNGFEVAPNETAKKTLFEPLTKKIVDFGNSVYWLNSIRVHPPREFDIGAGIEIGVKSDGKNTAETLWFLGENQYASFNEINEWLIETCGRKIDITSAAGTVGDNGRRKVRLETVPVTELAAKSGAIRVPILDSGEGIAQALPVVTLCAQAANNELGEFPIVAIEQPELHLHPRATVALTNFLIKCIKKNKDVRFIIETHSESFLLALQTALVEKNLLLDDIACYWVHASTSDDGSSLSEISFDNEGYISENWPDEVFNETTNQAKDLIYKRENQ